MKTHMQRAIDRLKQRVLELSAEVENNVAEAAEALMALDARKAEAVIEADRRVDLDEVEVEEECLKILALYQPVASDLRMVVAILKMTNDLERIGDYASTIAFYVTEIVKQGKVEVDEDFRELFETCRSMMRNSFDALVNADDVLALEVCRKDDEADELNRRICGAIQQRIHENSDRIDSHLALISISRAFERIGDYATNIAKDVVYLVRGSIIRHHVKDTLRQTR